MRDEKQPTLFSRLHNSKKLLWEKIFALEVAACANVKQRHALVALQASQRTTYLAK
jgi:hypothetical protein